MLKKLKDILNTYTDEELNHMELWINSRGKIEEIIIDDYSINLIEENLRTYLEEDKWTSITIKRLSTME